MKKFVIGIIAVFCLQAIFIGNTWLNTTLEPVSALPGTTELAAVNEPVDGPVDAPGDDVSRAAYRPRRRSALPARPRTTFTAGQYQAVATRSRKTPPVSAVPERVAVRDIKKPEKRASIERASLFAKAWPVIKKPYTWAKALVGKLD